MQSQFLFWHSWKPASEASSSRCLGFICGFQTVGAFGRLCVRVCLHVLNKEKAGREPDGFEDLQEIAGKFTEDLQGMAQVQAAASPSSTAIQVSNVLSASKAELALLQNKHIKVNEMHLGVIFLKPFE